MTKHLAYAAVFAAAAAVTAWAQTSSVQPEPEMLTWRVDGETRRAIAYSPTASSRGGRSPLVLSFHGRGDTMDNFQHTNLHQAWPQAIVVYFQGLRGRDALNGWQVEKDQDGDRDLKLVDARIYSTGFSNGASFTYLLWAERPTVFAAFGPVAARLRPSVLPKQPKPILHIAGETDATIPFDVQERAIETARRVNGVSSQTSCGNGCMIYGADSATPVMTWIHPGGHVYPKSTSDRIAKFFREHPNKP